MKRIGYLAGVAMVALFSMASYTVNTAFAGSDCCGAKQASAAEKAETKCVACGKAISNKDKAVKVEHEGKTVYLCCEGCAEKFKKNPGECMRDKEQK
ncbi:MAG: YHS domain-containing protein [Candidatus Brocadia sp.]|jgi:YHS domain-containing protein